jgi:Leucine-rich repeat (LRR) protein
MIDKKGLKLSEAIIMHPKCLTQTRLSIVEKQITEVDFFDCSRLSQITSVYLSKNLIYDITHLPSLFPSLASLSLS